MVRSTSVPGPEPAAAPTAPSRRGRRWRGALSTAFYLVASTVFVVFGTRAALWSDDGETRRLGAACALFFLPALVLGLLQVTGATGRLDRVVRSPRARRLLVGVLGGVLSLMAGAGCLLITTLDDHPLWPLVGALFFGGGGAVIVGAVLVRWRQSRDGWGLGPDRANPFFDTDEVVAALEDAIVYAPSGLGVLAMSAVMSVTAAGARVAVPAGASGEDALVSLLPEGRALPETPGRPRPARMDRVMVGRSGTDPVLLVAWCEEQGVVEARAYAYEGLWGGSTAADVLAQTVEHARLRRLPG